MIYSNPIGSQRLENIILAFITPEATIFFFFCCRFQENSSIIHYFCHHFCLVLCSLSTWLRHLRAAPDGNSHLDPGFSSCLSVSPGQGTHLAGDHFLSCKDDLLLAPLLELTEKDEKGPSDKGLVSTCWFKGRERRRVARDRGTLDGSTSVVLTQLQHPHLHCCIDRFQIKSLSLDFSRLNVHMNSSVKTL